MKHTNILYKTSAFALSAASLLAACTPQQSSEVKDRWNTPNNPVVMFATESAFETDFDVLPLNGRPEKMPWSDHYWPTYHGGITYRWGDAKSALLENTVRRSSDRTFAGQLDDDLSLQNLRSEVLGYVPYTKEQLSAMSPEARKKLISTLSPAEKLDIYRGAFDYPTVAAERARTGIERTLRKLPSAGGPLVVNPNYVAKSKIPTWFGLCHAWAPATAFFQEPNKVTVTSKDGFEVPMASSDVKALLTYAVHNDQGGKTPFMGQRCNDDFDAATVDPILEDLKLLTKGDMTAVNAKVKEFMQKTSLSYEASLAAASFFYNFAPSQAEADSAFKALYDGLIASKNGKTKRNLAKVYKRSLTNFVDAGSTASTNWDVLESTLTDAIRIASPTCTDTNAGAFHLVLANKLGLQKTSFVVDVTRDDEVWNQAAALYSSRVMETYTGDNISADAAPGTVREVRVRTQFLYTTEAAMQWDRGGNNKDLRDYHVEAGDNYRSGNQNVKRYEYRLELDIDGKIIGGSWISTERPDFVWGMEDFIFDEKFSDIADIYYQAK
ncbi:MAG TPA: hypothetical protein VE954_11115 [Oligoflexus sp.]|uniref:hypothetical protein n=1 Tax=Oligoflexus sp. TaxID=1971216 RepID=UPI002D4324DC|nr:hypothetical protein [Oligoflexus sp.]HYX33656.1 hypothetical protein [Oligoflexus sp.]